MYDIFDCIFECLSSPSCLSFNLAASKGENGKLWCDLLSSDRYRNLREYNENMTSHHFFTMVGPGFWYIRFFTTLILLLYSKSSNQVPFITMNYFCLFQSPCSSMPCQNGGTCVTNYKYNTFECDCDKGFIGEYCEKGRLQTLFN